MTREEADILRDLWRFSVSERYSDKEIREALDKAIEALKEQRPQGEWILDAVAPHSISWFRCSYCGYKYEAYKKSNFCPNCGSDNRPKIHGCSFADEECKNNPCKDCGLREG